MLPFLIPAIISAAGAIGGAAISKKKSKQQKALEDMQAKLLETRMKRQEAIEPVQDSIIRAYASMVSPQGGFDPSSLSKLSGTPVPNYYDNPQANRWWGGQ